MGLIDAIVVGEVERTEPPAQPVDEFRHALQVAVAGQMIHVKADSGRLRHVVGQRLKLFDAIADAGSRQELHIERCAGRRRGAELVDEINEKGFGSLKDD